MTDEQKPEGQTKESKFSKIEVDRALCIGAASCVAVAGEVFELDNENKAVVKNSRGADDDTILLAAKSCPTLAIKLYNKEGKQVFPE